jgi:hypothetical protein
VSGTLCKARFGDYREGQGDISSPASYANVRSHWPYFGANYANTSASRALRRTSAA